MKTKILCALLALCLFASLLPMTVLAADPEVTVTFCNTTREAAITVTVAPGETKYVITNDSKQFEAWTAEEPPADKFIELRYPADGKATLQATLKNIDSDNTSSGLYNNHSIWFGAGEYAVVIDLVGENKISSKSSSCIYHDAKKGMTITGDGSLATLSTGGVSGSIWTRAGDLLIKDTTLDLTCSQLDGNSRYNAILSTYGNVIIEGSEITYSTDGGCLVFMGSSAFMGTDDEGNARFTLDDSADRYITIKDSKITGSASLSTFSSNNPTVVINSTLELKKTASNTEESKAIFYPTPKLEGDYGAWGGTAKKPENAKQYDTTDKKLWKASVGYLKLVPGTFELPTEPEPTTKPTTPKETTPKPTTKPTTPAATTPQATKPEATTPEATKPNATTPEATKPNATTPEATKPNATTPEATKPNATTPETTKPAAGNEKESGNPLTVVLIVIVVLVVAAGGALGVILYLQKKKAK